MAQRRAVPLLTTAASSSGPVCSLGTNRRGVWALTGGQGRRYDPATFGNGRGPEAGWWLAAIKEMCMPGTDSTSNVRRTRKRGTLLVSVIAVVLSVAACGRASEEEINQALGITPTPTQSAEQIAEATSRAEAAAATREAQLASGSPASGEVALAGDAVRGQTQFSLWCMQCHGPAGTAPDVLEAGGATAGMSYEELLAFLRDGTNHSPGPIPNFRVSDQSIVDIQVYIQAQTGS